MQGGRTPPCRTGRAADVRGIPEAYAAAAAREAVSSPDGIRGFDVATESRSTENRALKNALELLGFTVTNKSAGLVRLDVKRGGRALVATDEEGYRLSPEQLFTISAFIELQSGEKSLAVPYDAPAALDGLARGYGARVLRLGRDREADTLWVGRPRLRDGVSWEPGCAHSWPSAA